MTRYYMTEPKQPEVITRDGRLKRLPSTSPTAYRHGVRDVVKGLNPLKGIAYALAAIADNVATLTDTVSLRGEELHTQLAQLNENMKPSEKEENSHE